MGIDLSIGVNAELCVESDVGAAEKKAAAYKKYGDLITASIYMIKKGDKQVELTDYEDWHEDGTYGTAVITLDGRLSPAANAQRYYKKYNKTKTARVELSKQIELGDAELRYIDSVFDALTHAETSADLSAYHLTKSWDKP